MGKVYSSALRAQDEEIERFGSASEETNRRATSAWVPDLSSFDLGEEFLRWEGVDFKEVQRVHAEWRKLGSPVSATKSAYEHLVTESGLSKRKSSSSSGRRKRKSGARRGSSLGNELGEGLVDDIFGTLTAQGDKQAQGYELSEMEEGRMEILKQFDSFRDRQKMYSNVRRSEDGTNPRVSLLDILSGLALVSKGTKEQKSGFIFSLFDFNRRRVLDKDEALATLHSAVRGFCVLKGAPFPDREGVEWLFLRRLCQSVRTAHSLAKTATIDQVDMKDFVAWCKADPSVDMLISTGSSVGTGSASAFAERKKIEQKKILMKLARIEGSLELIGEPRFEPAELRDFRDNLRINDGTAQKYGALARKSDAPDDKDDNGNNNNQSQAERGTDSDSDTQDGGAHGMDTLDEDETNDMPKRNQQRRRVAEIGHLILHDIFPLLKRTKPRGLLAKGPGAEGLTLEQFTSMSEAEREDWAQASAMVSFICSCFESVFEELDLTKCSLPWLIEVAQRCGVYDFDPLLLLLKEEKVTSGHSNHQVCAVSARAFIQWVQTWPLPNEVFQRASAGKFWAWARVLVPLGSLFRALVIHNGRTQLFEMIDRGVKELFVDKGSKTITSITLPSEELTRTQATVTVQFPSRNTNDGNESEEHWAIEASLSYQSREVPIVRSVESSDMPKTSLEELEEAQAKADADEAAGRKPKPISIQVNEDADNQLEFEIMQVQRCPLLLRGKEFYEKVFHTPPPNQRGSIGKAQLGVEGVGAYVMINFASSLVASAKAICLAAFKLKVLFTHTFWETMPALKGVHVVEYQEYVGSAKVVRLVFFLDEAIGELFVEKLRHWFGPVDNMTCSMKIGSSAASVASCEWDGSVESLWRTTCPVQRRETMARDAAELEMAQSDGKLLHAMRRASTSDKVRRKHAFDGALQHKLGLHTVLASKVGFNPRKKNYGNAISESEFDQANQDRTTIDVADSEEQIKLKYAERARVRKEREEVMLKEPTDFGLECIHSLVKMFDKDGDGALDLKEMNSMLKLLGQPEFETFEDYKSAVTEDGLEATRNGLANLKTLAFAYVKAPKESLAKDIGRAGLMSCSLAQCGFQFGLDVTGVIDKSEGPIGRTCKDSFQSSLKNQKTSKSAGCSSGWMHIAQVLQATAGGQASTAFAIREHLWRNHAKSAEFHLKYPHWTELLAELEPFIKVLLPERQMERLMKCLFEPGYFRNIISDFSSIVQALRESLKFAQVGCADDEVEGEDDEASEVPDFDSEEFQAAHENQTHHVPADFIQRAFLKLVFHLLNSVEGSISGIDHVYASLPDGQNVSLNLQGFNLFEWLIYAEAEENEELEENHDDEEEES